MYSKSYIVFKGYVNAWNTTLIILERPEQSSSEQGLLIFLGQMNCIVYLNVYYIYIIIIFFSEMSRARQINAVVQESAGIVVEIPIKEEKVWKKTLKYISKKKYGGNHYIINDNDINGGWFWQCPFIHLFTTISLDF